MTQIIGVLTKDYALLASDRRLTYSTGPKAGEIFDDNTCKLVNFCNMSGIAYSGLAHVATMPTHEWIAKTLALATCRDVGTASSVLTHEANVAFSTVSSSMRRHIFLIAGWALFGDPPVLRPHFCVITNMLDDSGQLIKLPRDTFTRRVRTLSDKEDFCWYSIGQPITKKRIKGLDRNLRQLIKRNIGPKEALRLLVDEIINTSVKEKSKTVGTKILGFCIPRQSVEQQLRTGHWSALAQQPNDTTVAFTYFEPGYSELLQYGPTVVCGEYAVTDLETESEPERSYQSSQVRILHMPGT